MKIAIFYSINIFSHSYCRHSSIKTQMFLKCLMTYHDPWLTASVFQLGRSLEFSDCQSENSRLRLSVGAWSSLTFFLYLVPVCSPTEQIFQNLRQEYSRIQRRRQLEGAFNQSEACSSSDAPSPSSSPHPPSSPPGKSTHCRSRCMVDDEDQDGNTDRGKSDGGGGLRWSPSGGLRQVVSVCSTPSTLLLRWLLQF